jgi:hypothetical protein
VMLVGVHTISSADGGEVIQTPQGSLIKPAKNTNQLEINLTGDAK